MISRLFGRLMDSTLAWGICAALAGAACAVYLLVRCR